MEILLGSISLSRKFKLLRFLLLLSFFTCYFQFRGSSGKKSRWNFMKRAMRLPIISTLYGFLPLFSFFSCSFLVDFSQFNFFSCRIRIESNRVSIYERKWFTKIQSLLMKKSQPFHGSVLAFRSLCSNAYFLFIIFQIKGSSLILYKNTFEI